MEYKDLKEETIEENSAKISERTYNKLLKVSRTIADLDGKPSIEDSHILEAIRYRTLDNKYWG